jgi:hypothetical protein
MHLRPLIKMQKVFSIETSKLFSFLILKMIFFSSSLRDLLTAVGKPAERLSDIEVITIKSLINQFILCFP